MADDYEERLKAIGEAFRKRREELGMSQRGLSMISKLHHNYISGIERGERNPTLISTWKLCEALDIEFVEIYQSLDE